MIQIQIPNPCHEDWDKMTPTQKGAFCKVCSKEVLDFTSSSNDDIKSTLLKEKEPCVRILQSQMDEMNFFEWFRSLVLRQKLKYIFLFSFFISCQNLQAQDLIKPQNVAIDKRDIDNIDSAVFADQTVNSEESDAVCSVPEPFIWAGSISVSDGWDYPLGGAVYPIEVTSVYGGLVLIDPNAKYEIEFQDQIIIEDEIFSFRTDQDSLLFHSVMPEQGEIFLEIEQDRIGKEPYPSYKPVFKSPLLLEKGENVIKIPISKYVNGSYTIKIKSKKGEGIARINYW